MHLLNDTEVAGHAVSGALLPALLAVLVAWVAIYMVYKMFWHADFGLPVRRRLLCRRMSVQRDQVAFVPLWWSDLQIQHAVSSHWKNSLRSSVKAGAARQPERAAGS